MGFGKSFGKILAKTAKNIGKGALAVSKDPEVVGEIATLVGHPEVVPIIAVTTPVVKAVVKAVKDGHPDAVAAATGVMAPSTVQGNAAPQQ